MDTVNRAIYALESTIEGLQKERVELKIRLDNQGKQNQLVQDTLAKEDGAMTPDGEWKQAPHCDPLVIHAPGECQYCDKYAETRQKNRIIRHVNFTGHYDSDKTLCPSEYFRPAETIHLWHGNQPQEIGGQK